MEIHALLGIRSDSDKKVVRDKYIKMMAILHPNNKKTGDVNKFIMLQKCYKNFETMGDDSLCFKVVNSFTSTIICRCGGTYQIPTGFIGTIECDFCSCFIIVEEPYDLL